MDSELTFGAWLKSRRRQLDLTQKGLAHFVGCSVGTIRKMEADERRPSRQLAGLIAENLDIPPNQLEVFIAFARSEPFVSDTPIPVIPAAADQFPIIPQAKKEAKIKHNLPLESTPLVGREAELAALNELFTDQDKRLVTIVGPGGIGKTRLAIACAERQLAHGGRVETHPYKDGIFFADLTPLTETKRLVLHLAEALNLRVQAGAREERSPKQQLLDYLRNKQLLLVLDNFEQLLSPLQIPEQQLDTDAATLIVEILRAATQVRILITSRERLRVHMEQVFNIDGLTFPDWEATTPGIKVEDIHNYAAMEFFQQAAQRSRQDFSLENEDELRALVCICQLVGGMPLGLELAAAWVDVLPLSDIAIEIQQCLDFLETELRDVPPRHRSMRATFDYSWGNLDEKEQSVFTKLTIFRGGFTREAAHAVTGASLRQLSRLVNKSFIHFSQQQKRYQIHELLHQYGTEQLAQDPELQSALQDCHSKYYCQMLADYNADLKGPRQAQANLAIGMDLENVRQSWDHAINQQDLEAIGIAADSLHRFYLHWGRFVQAVKDFENAITRLGTGEPVGELGIILGRLLAYLGRFYAEGERQPTKSSEVLQESLDLLERNGDRKDTLYPLLFLADLEPSFEERNQLFQECLDLARELEDQWAIGHALLYMGIGAERAGDFEQAERRYQEALKQFRRTGDPGGIMASIGNLTVNTVKRGAYQQALSLGREAMLQAQEFDPNYPFMGLSSFGIALYAAGDHEEAEALFQQGRSLSRENDRGYDITNICLFYLGEIAFYSGDYALAKQRYQEGLVRAIEIQLFETVARYPAALARLHIIQGDYLQARGQLQEVLKITIPLDRPPLLMVIFSAAAELFTAERNLEFAVMLATFVINHPSSEAMIKERAEGLLEQLEAALTVDDLANIHQYSQESDLDSLVKQLLIDLEKQ